MSSSEWIGSLGVGLLLLAFVLNLGGRLDRTSRLYRLLNLLGASLACWAALTIRFLPFVVLEGAWALSAAVALLRPSGSG